MPERKTEEGSTWCEALGIEVPSLEAVKDHREAKPYTLLIVALLERGEPMTLADVAARFEAAGVAPREQALRSLQRCRPGRAPVYRDGELYSLDPHDDDLDLWAFRLGLRPPEAPAVRIVRPPPPPLPGDDVALSVAELDEAWEDAGPTSWSTQRLALAVLDAHGGPLTPDEVATFVRTRCRYARVRVKDAERFGRSNCPVKVVEDGRWDVAPGADAALRSVRKAVRAQVAVARRAAAARPDPTVLEAQRKAWERRRAKRRRELAAASRALLVGFPPQAPQAVALLDVGAHTVETVMHEGFDALRERLAGYDVLGALNVRALLRALDYDPGNQRLAELGPPQKTKKLNKRGRTLEITTKMLVQGSCNMGRPFGDPKRLAAYLESGELTRFRRRLEADAKALYAYYAFGRLHGAVRLRWGFLDEWFPVPWVHRDEQTLHGLMREARESGALLEVVTGSAPGWKDPWARARRARAEGTSAWNTVLWGEDDRPIDAAEVQLARLVDPAR